MVPLDDPDAGPGCGDGIRQGTEECDNGKLNGPNAGCEKACTFSCILSDPHRGDAHCDPHDPCKGQGVCNSDHTCSTVNALPEGADCGGGNFCRNGACQAPVCGDGQVNPGEECDDGTNDGTHGCSPGCKFTCLSTDPARNCAPTDPCQGASSCTDSTHTCSPRTPAVDGTACGTGKVCKSGTCVLNTCGNGHVDPGEDCEPPGTATCDANCKTITPAVCGNGIREKGEQCDDGNLINLDGCDSTCHFEQDHRANAVQMMWGTDAYCTANALGAAIGSSAQTTLQNEVDATVKAGAFTLGFQFLGLNDLTGSNGSFKLGGMNGSRVAPPPGHTYDGSKDLDWWYAVPDTALDASRKPKAQLSAILNSKHLTAGPGHMSLTLILGGGPTTIQASNVKLKGDVGGTSIPLFTHAATPGHTSAENLDPALQSFDALSNGELCGNASAASIAAAPAPASVQSGGSTACDEGYTATNTLLDVVARGCTIYGIITAVAATQPDQVDTTMPVAGAGGPYKLVIGTGNHVTGCKDKNNATVTLSTCLNAAAYSVAMTFGTDRVVLK